MYRQDTGNASGDSSDSSGEFLTIDEITKLAAVRQSLQSSALSGCNPPKRASFSAQDGGKQQIPLPDGAPQPGAYAGAPGEGLQRTHRPSFALLGVAASSVHVEAMKDHSDYNEDGSLASVVEEGEVHKASESSQVTSAVTVATTTITNRRILQQCNHTNSAEMSVNDVFTCEDSSSGLAVAEAVEEEDDMPRQHAAEFDMDEAQRRKKESMNHFKTRIFLAVILFIAVVMVCIAMVVVKIEDAHKKSGSQPSMETPANSSASRQPSTMEDALLDLFPQETVQLIMGDPQSSQSQAFQWLLDDIRDTQGSVSEDRIKQRFALATVYFGTNGDSWTNNESWLIHNIHECDWFTKPDYSHRQELSNLYPGLLTEFETPASKCSSNGLYQHLWLDSNHLVGSLPNELYMMTSLLSMSAGLNRLRGTISTQVAQLTQLTHLSLFYLAEVVGPIPSELGLLTGLRGIGLNNNGHTGTIPSELWQLTNMETVVVMENPELHGIIPTEIGNFHKLRWFISSGMHLTGTIPTEVGRLKKLEWITLNANKLTGTVPSEFGTLPEVLLIELFGNALVGSLPTEFGHLTSLTMFKAGGNRLYGSIPSEYGHLTSITRGLALQNNSLTGTIPTELSRLTSLEKLKLEENQLSGQVPSEFGKLTSAGLLDLSQNLLSGTVPQELSTLQHSLHTLHLEGNALLSGIWPESLCSIHGTCKVNPLFPCKGNYGLFFDCTSLLCGCECLC
ncbi:STYKc [Seminavis robusta]|uniref:STYKc n=1 Tax=Seminavis robusta TaxID=568900 RepID=A0A9N8HBU2_9STRA|nr:STYKc [Seminavis robusta]|eukprot:Sro378_g130270.1 STYKc (733) ;mRNA; f:30364-32646